MKPKWNMQDAIVNLNPTPRLSYPVEALRELINLFEQELRANLIYFGVPHKTVKFTDTCMVCHDLKYYSSMVEAFEVTKRIFKSALLSQLHVSDELMSKVERILEYV